MRVVVDDEEHLRHVMRLTLEASGYEVGEAADGEEALRLFGDGFSFDAILLDQRMPGLDGLETLKRMKARRADVCVIMVTVYATVELAVDAMKLGATDFVRKPMTPETLRHAVAAALAKHGRRVAASAVPAGSPHAPAGVTSRDLDDEWVLHSSSRTPWGVRRTAIERPLLRRQTRHRGCWGRGYRLDRPAGSGEDRSECSKDLSSAGGFWHRQAENALINYLWSEATVPPGGRLVIDRVSGPMVDEAMAWSED